MKIQELAKELDMDVNVVLKKAQSMGYNVADKDSLLEGVDATVVKNVLIHAKDKTETKVDMNILAQSNAMIANRLSCQPVRL